MISGAAHQGAITTSGKLSENSRRGSEPIIDLFTWADDPLSSRLHRGNGNASGQVASGRGFISEDPIGFGAGMLIFLRMQEMNLWLGRSLGIGENID